MHPEQAEISDLLHLDAITVTGATVGENIAGAEVLDTGVIRKAAEPLDQGGALVVLTGSLCPDGAVMKITAADLQALAALADAGKLTVPVAEVFALEDVAKAFALSQGGHVRGKIAIEVSR